MAGDESNQGFGSMMEVLLSAGLLAVLLVLLAPLPPFVLDMLLALNIALSVLLLLVTLGIEKPLDVSVFPSLLLLLTLYRLSLNVATTRLILLDGDAGRIVTTFGDFVVGGNLVVGLVIFLILVIVQFIVITKGAGRVSEVAARFTLDALPGKQMAIDAELGAGALTDKEARAKREDLAREAEFYGAMDGASKFVRGDAIAGLIVTAINLIGGAVLGVAAGMTMLESIRKYSVLTVGDGLVSQIPALIIAVTSGLLVTKAGTRASIPREIAGQVLANTQPLFAGAIVLGLIAFTPGLPKLPFLALSAGLFFYVRSRNSQEKAKAVEADKPVEPTEQDREKSLRDRFISNDRASVMIGARLIPLVEAGRTKGLANRIRKLRQDLTNTRGMWVPPIRIQDNVDLEPDSYRLMISGREVARGEVKDGYYLAIAPSDVRSPIEGVDTVDPAFGLPARWIDAANRRRAELNGYTVVDGSTVLITHLGEVLRRHSHELLSRQDLQGLLDELKKEAPSLVDELKPETLRISTLHQVLVLLLEERVPITDLPRIVEAVLQSAPTTKDPYDLADAARQALGRAICDRYRDANGKIRVIVMEPKTEQRLRDFVRGRELSLPPGPLQKLIQLLDAAWQKANLAEEEIAVMCDATLRRPIRTAILRALPELATITYREVPSDLLFNPVALVRPEELFEPAEAAPAGRAVGEPAAA